MKAWIVASFLFAIGGNIPIALLCLLIYVIFSEDDPKAYA